MYTRPRRPSSARAAAWAPRALSQDRPVYVALADAIADDVASGRLRPGTRLPAQRALAARLGVDFTTVSRGYAEAARRGLVSGQVGRGTFVRGPAREAGIAPRLAPDGVIDLTLNLPPEGVVEAAAAALPATLVTIGADPGFAALLRYQQPAGREEHRVAAAAWLAPRYGAPVTPDRVVLCGGAQHALAAVLVALRAMPDAGPIATEELTYPGFKALAEGLGLAVVGLPLDGEGLRADAVREACRAAGVRVVYCTPTFQNPTASVMSAARRRELARVARECDLTLVEDDVYGPFARRGSNPAPSVSSRAPERGYYIASLSKVLSPGLRLAYLVAPTAAAAARVAAGVRATTWMASPLAAEIATRWIEDGTAERVVAAGRAEVAARQRLALALLGAGRGGLTVHAPEGTMHAWLELPAPWTSAEFVVRARQAGVAVVPAESFAVGPRTGPAAVRVSLTAAPSLDVLRDALGRLAALAAAGPGAGTPAL